MLPPNVTNPAPGSNIATPEGRLPNIATPGGGLANIVTPNQLWVNQSAVANPIDTPAQNQAFLNTQQASIPLTTAQQRLTNPTWGMTMQQAVTYKRDKDEADELQRQTDRWLKNQGGQFTLREDPYRTYYFGGNRRGQEQANLLADWPQYIMERFQPDIFPDAPKKYDFNHPLHKKQMKSYYGTLMTTDKLKDNPWPPYLERQIRKNPRFSTYLDGIGGMGAASAGHAFGPTPAAQAYSDALAAVATARGQTDSGLRDYAPQAYAMQQGFPNMGLAAQTIAPGLLGKIFTGMINSLDPNAFNELVSGRKSALDAFMEDLTTGTYSGSDFSGGQGPGGTAGEFGIGGIL